MDGLAFTSGRVLSERGRLYTVSSGPGKRVYGERLVRWTGEELREWDPRRSKLGAVLYLGASSGTTASHVADVCSDGKVYCVEFAQRMFRDLVKTCEDRPAMIPILGDATKPGEYRMFADTVDIVYQDVAQKRQADIICDNMDEFSAPIGMVAVKARSEDVTASPEKVFEEAEARIRERGFRILDARSLEPYEKAHEMIVFGRR